MILDVVFMRIFTRPTLVFFPKIANMCFTKRWRGGGDIQLLGIENVASAYTPVPGGVGPMTITTLIRQTVEAAEKALG